MNVAPRWRKVIGDLRLARGRVAMVVVALALGLGGVTAIFTAFQILTREISRNYLETNPAAAVLNVGQVDDAMVHAIRGMPGIADAEAGATIRARILDGDHEPVALLLFVVPDFTRQRISMFRSESGAWPPPAQTMLLERTALELIHARIGDDVRVVLPGAPPCVLAISGAVHDPGLAPAWQEQTAYGYITPATLASLGRSDALNLVKLTVTDQRAGIPAIEAASAQVAGWLRSQGHEVGEIRIPPPRTHPHQTQMTAILGMLLLFGLLAFLLSAVLTATVISGLLAKQVRQIGIMKAIGARSWQIARLYLAAVALMALASVVIGMPLGVAAGRGFAQVVAGLLNLTVYSRSVPGWMLAGLGVLAVFVPLLIALIPIRAAVAITVQRAILEPGDIRPTHGPGWFETRLLGLRGLDRPLLLAIRNSFRRRGRLVLVLGLLVAAGALFMAGMDVGASWRTSLADAAADRHFQLEFRLDRPVETDRIDRVIAGLPHILSMETSSIEPVAVARPDGLDIVRTYPDGGHASFTLRSVAPASEMVHVTPIAGRWLQPGDRDTVVLNHLAQAMHPSATVGSRVSWRVDGRIVDVLVVGIVRQLLTPAAAYITPEGFAQMTGRSGVANLIRVAVVDPSSAAEVARGIEAGFAHTGIGISQNISEDTLDGALNGHVRVLIVALLSMAALMAAVGGLGMMSSQATSVIERTREFGIMRAIGARSATIIGNVISEGVFIGLLSWPIALTVSLPLAWGIGRLIGTLAFRYPLPLVVSPGAAAIWFAIVIGGSIAASASPAWSASRLTIRETLAHT